MGVGLKRDAIEPEAFISASAIGIYPVNKGVDLNEETPTEDTSFLGKLCSEWEAQALSIPAKRKVILRIGVVLGKNGGMLSRLIPIFKLGLGGKTGSGTQMMSWIHMDDLVSIFLRAVQNSEMKGIFNATSPGPVDNHTFSQTLAQVLQRPCRFSVPEFVLKIFMGEMSGLVLDSQKIFPKKLLGEGFSFRFDNIDKAMQNLCR